MEYILLIIMGIVIYICYIKSKTSKQRYKPEENHSTVQNGNENKVDETPMPTIRVISPNGGENWVVGTIQKIAWTSENLNSNGSIYIFYWYNNNWQLITQLSPTFTSYSWNIPNTPTASTWIWIGNLVDNKWQSWRQSEQAFTISSKTKIQTGIDIYEKYNAYLDIETTSLSPSNGDLTVIGLCLEDGNEYKVIQLVGEEISSSKLIEIIKKAEILYTYNGSRFDLPYINGKLGIDLTKYCMHKDLMYECWRRNLYRGFKEVERKLGIKRNSVGIDGRIAAQLWHSYKKGNKEALASLLEYNKEDVLNLKMLREKLKV